MCVERRLVATRSPQNLQRAFPGEMWTRCTYEQHERLFAARQALLGSLTRRNQAASIVSSSKSSSMIDLPSSMIPAVLLGLQRHGAIISLNPCIPAVCVEQTTARLLVNHRQFPERVTGLDTPASTELIL